MPRARRTFSEAVQGAVDRHNTRQRRNAELVAEVAAATGSTDGTIDIMDLIQNPPNEVRGRAPRGRRNQVSTPTEEVRETESPQGEIPATFSPAERLARYRQVSANVTRRPPKTGAGYGNHKPQSMAAYLDEALLHGEWVHVMVENIKEFWHRDDRKALQKIKGHIGYVRNQGFFVEKTTHTNADGVTSHFYLMQPMPTTTQE